jgi:hypothetical protein
MKVLNDVGIYISAAGSAVGGFNAAVNNPNALPSYSSYIAFTDCTGGGQYEIFTVYGASLTNGTRVWSDSARTELLVEATFVYNNVSYNTNNNGDIYSNSWCGVYSWIIYHTCNNDRDATGGETYYTAYRDSALQVGVTLFTDDLLTTPATVSQVVYAGMVYYLVNGVIQSVDTCMYSLPYSIYGCGQYDADNFYTNSTGVSNASLYGVYARNSAGVTMTNLTIYRYGYGTYIQTDGTGQIGTEFSCPT